MFFAGGRSIRKREKFPRARKKEGKCMEMLMGMKRINSH